MLFTSIEYYIFLMIIVLLFYVLPYRHRWILLLLASYYFYMFWNPWYVILLILSSLIDYGIALGIHTAQKRSNKVKWLLVSITLNLFILFSFKYLNFFITQLSEIFSLWNPQEFTLITGLLLPLGISFYTFQTMSFSIDVYRGYFKPERHLGRYLLYVSFFPQLVAGPIERARQMFSQFHFKTVFQYSNLVEGFRLILWGLFKKIVIADKLAIYVDRVYSRPDLYEGLTIYVASVFFLFQIYCDFSGYTDIARGSARLFGVDLSINFKHRVYFITSFVKFWRGWHITLTNWFRDYVFFSLAGLKKGLIWIVVATFITFTLNGFWHGANWTFMLWGIINGLFVGLEVLLSKPLRHFFERIGIKVKSNTHQLISFLFCFNIAIVSLIFFRADSITSAYTLVNNLFVFHPMQIGQTMFGIVHQLDFFILIFLLVFMDFINIRMKDIEIDKYLKVKSESFRWMFYCAILLMIFYLGEPPRRNFIYFEF